MKTPRSLVSASSLLAALILVPLMARGEETIRIRLPHPIDHISKRLHQVGSFFSRTARRLEAEEPADEARVEMRRESPAPPKEVPSSRSAAKRKQSVEAIVDDVLNHPARYRPMPVDPDPPLPSRRRASAPVASVKATAPQPPAPEAARASPAPSADSPAPMPPPAPVTSGAADGTESDPAAKEQTEARAAGESAATVYYSPPSSPVTRPKPAPPPRHEYGKPVPGRRGLVYPPGVKASPENMVDVRDIPPGTKVRDPATGIVFLVP